MSDQKHPAGAQGKAVLGAPATITKNEPGGKVTLQPMPPNPKDLLPAKPPRPENENAEAADEEVARGRAAAEVGEAGAANLRVMPNCHLGHFVAGDVIPRHAVDDPDWHIAQRVCVETSEEPTVVVPVLGPPPEDADAAMVENKKLRLELNAVRIRDQQERNRREKEFTTAAAAADEKEAAEARAAELAESNEKLKAEIEHLKKQQADKQANKPGS